MNEAFIKQRMVKEIRDENGYARRIEDKFTVGMPDMFIFPHGSVPLWVEVKVIRGQTFGPSARQLVELRKLHRPPLLHAAVLGWKDGQFYLGPVQATLYVPGCIVKSVADTWADFFNKLVEQEALRGGI